MQPKTRHKVIDSLMQLAGEQPWHAVTLETVAERAGVPLRALRGAFDGRLDILGEFTRRIDESVLDAADPDLAGEDPRERLFDILFSRIEALNPHREAIRNLGAASRRDPLLAIELNRLSTTSMAWMLTAAGIRATGPTGCFRAQGLALVWSRVLGVWLEEDDPALPRTMAELDRRLRQSERLVRQINWFCEAVRPPRRSRRRYSAPSGPLPGTDLAEGHPS